MKKFIYILLLTIVAISCNDEDYNIKEGFSTISLKINSLENEEVTRAVSTDEQERVIKNLYIFIVNQDSRIAFRQYFDGSNSNSMTVKMTNVPTGVKTIYAIANFDNNVVDITKEYLDGISTLNEIKNTISSLKGNYLERSDNFIMSGITEGVSIEPKLGNTASLSLVRLDSRVKFIVKGIDGLVFTPFQWRMMSVSKKVPLFPRTSFYEAGDLENDYFNTDWTNFEDINDGVSSFEIYVPENNIAPKLAIPTSINDKDLSYNQRYALREEREKIESNDYWGDFKYASMKSTYVQLKGNVSYEIENEQKVSAEVAYTIHLGGVAGVDDYKTNRNTKYTYNVEIKSINSIITEVSTGEVIRPGAVGSIVVSKETQNIDAHNETFHFSFSKQNIGDNLTWSVETPFSKGEAKDNPLDYKWIYFRVNNRRNNKYISDFRTYPGDSKIYPENDNVNPSSFLDSYIKDIKAGNDKLLNIKQLVIILKENKRRFLINQEISDPKKHLTHLFYEEDAIHFTAFANEYYYEKDPTNESLPFNPSLWKKFVNTEPRIINLALEDNSVFTGANNSYSSVIFSIRQNSIQTMFNKYKDEDFTAWGSQVIQDETPLVFEKQTSKNAYYTDWNNGRKNSINMWKESASSVDNWSDYINTATWKMKNDYEAAKYKCLRLNRDTDGDGKIDPEEINWYLTSINQLTDIWLGEPAYIQDIKLYKRTTWYKDDRENQWFVSSTTGTSKIENKDRPYILWSSEGSSTGFINDYTNGIDTKVYYRCGRNLGIPQDASIDIYPEDFAEFKTETINGEIVRTISVSRLDPGAVRQIKETEELSDHNERGVDGYNRPYWKFQINNSVSVEGSGQTWQDARTQAKRTDGKRLCPKGWRVPNQRELALMYSRIKSAQWSNIWEGNHNYFSSTGFSFVNYDAKRVGFAVRTNLFLINNTGEIGGARCVKDVD